MNISNICVEKKKIRASSAYKLDIVAGVPLKTLSIALKSDECQPNSGGKWSK
jgi:hypothetical protein